MDLYDFYSQIFHAVASDDQLSSWAVLTFGQAHKVYIDFDPGEPPAATDRPYVIFEEPGFDTHQDRPRNTYAISATLSIDTSGLETVVEDNLRITGGTEAMLDFIGHFKRVVAESLPANFTVGFAGGAASMETDTEVVGVIDILFDEAITIGTSPLA